MLDVLASLLQLIGQMIGLSVIGCGALLAVIGVAVIIHTVVSWAAWLIFLPLNWLIRVPDFKSDAALLRLARTQCTTAGAELAAIHTALAVTRASLVPCVSARDVELSAILHRLSVLQHQVAGISQ